MAKDFSTDPFEDFRHINPAPPDEFENLGRTPEGREVLEKVLMSRSSRVERLKLIVGKIVFRMHRKSRAA